MTLQEATQQRKDSTDKMEKHCAKDGLQERKDIVIIARELSRLMSNWVKVLRLHGLYAKIIQMSLVNLL